MRIFVVTNMYPSSASPRAGIFVQREVDQLRARGHEVEVYVVEGIRHASAYFTSIQRARAVERSFQPDVVHVHFGLTLIAALRLESPTVVTFHGSDLTIPWKRTVSRSLADTADVAVVVAETLRSRVPARVPVTVIPCGVDLARLSPLPMGEARAALGLSADARYLLFPSSPQRPEKRYELFRQAAAALDGFATIVLDEVDPAQMPTWLSAADCVVLTSATEGSPVVTKEALCCGTRLVSVDVGDVRAQVEGLSGCRIAEAEPEALAQAVSAALAEDPPDPSIAAARFDSAREIDALERLYREIAAKGQRGG